MVRKFIIDTDTGVDDAMALLMALDAHLKGEVRPNVNNIEIVIRYFSLRLRLLPSRRSMGTPRSQMQRLTF